MGYFVESESSTAGMSGKWWKLETTTGAGGYRYRQTLEDKCR